MHARHPLLVLLLVLATAGSAPAAAQETPLDRYVRMGLEANRDLAALELATLQAEARRDAVRARWRPSLGVEARYSMAEGGRAFDVPVGDLVNPIHQVLNGIVEGAPFPRVPNQRFDLLRDREQDTRLRVTQVLWNPALRAEARAGGFQLDAARAGTDAARRALERDIRVAYYQHANAARAEAILEDALRLVGENERSSTALWQASLVTRDHVHRARAERLEVEAERARAATDRRTAASWLNYLVGREPGAPVELSEADLSLAAERLEPGVLRAATEGEADAWIDRLAAQATATRPELRQLEHAVAAAEAGIAANRGLELPSVALAVDAGIQGRDYGLGSDHRYVMGSVVLSWDVTPGGPERARIREAELERRRLEALREDAAARIRLELERAALRARVALANVSTAEERREEARRAFHLVRRRQDEGLATALEFLDARATLTGAEMGYSIAETEALIRLAELEFAAGGPAGASAADGAARAAGGGDR